MNGHRGYVHRADMEWHPTVFSATELCYVAALFEGLRLIDAKAKELHVEPEINSGALQDYVRRKGDYLVYIAGLDEKREEENIEHPTSNFQLLTKDGRKAA